MSSLYWLTAQDLWVNVPWSFIVILYLLKAQKIICCRLQLAKGLSLYCLHITIIYCRPLFIILCYSNASLTLKALLYCPSFIVGLPFYYSCYSLKILSTESYALDHIHLLSIVCLMITDPYFLFSIWLLEQLSDPS